ncbi:probable E3 ubiquitin-protein ligase LUL4 [Punica granatum]|uniref:RING-type E3 ubiquitin transferase n=2 Tax=Punica granatum TaxID=22663 RepID=A0A218WMW7_PUNGR|nr:probable E3 ubiquitin-protein ligase LUL4 [Punica granatum]OWM74207.1 hypothetical protein CDL15_Pgr008520 [Punica granatum]PKI77154.1 hypothetical protein CRG98_002436 [Punica granatum]
MGNSWSNNRRRTYTTYPPNPHYPPPPYYYSATDLQPPPPPPPPPNPHQFYHHLPPPPLPPAYCAHPPAGYGSCGFAANPLVGRVHHYPHQYYANQHGGWPVVRAAVAQPPPPYVEHQNARKVRNVVNVHKDTVRIRVDELNPDHHLVSFVFDALHDGSIRILYFAMEESNCRFVPILPEAFTPLKFPFQKGLRQEFSQPFGTGIDLGFFELDDLSKPSPEEDVFPLVIAAETYPQLSSGDDHTSSQSPHMQITQAVLEKNGSDPFEVKVVKQVLWVDGVRYELKEIYGLGSSSGESYTNEGDGGKECVICMTEPKDTAVLPCRHMCMCNECSKALRLQSNKCPICRQPIEELIEIKINSDHS